MQLPDGSPWQKWDLSNLKPNDRGVTYKIEGLRTPGCVKEFVTGDLRLTGCPSIPVGNLTSFVGSFTVHNSSAAWYEVSSATLELLDDQGILLKDDYNVYGAGSGSINSSGRTSASIDFAQEPSSALLVSGSWLTASLKPILAFNRYIPLSAPRLGPHAVWPMQAPPGDMYETKPQKPYYYVRKK